MKDKREIEQLVEAYFNCTLSEAEEQRLRIILAQTDEESELIAEAKAVMGIFAMARKESRGNSRPLKKNITLPTYPKLLRRIAAVLVLAVAIGATAFFARQEQDVCLMYANGERIDNSDLVLVQMHSELSAVATANNDLDQAFLSELQCVGMAFDEIELQ